MSKQSPPPKQSEQEVELLPCPNPACLSPKVAFDSLIGNPMTLTHVYCRECLLTGPVEPTDHPGVKWNVLTRTASSEVTVESALAELRNLFPDASFLFARSEVSLNRRRGRHAITKEPAISEDSATNAKVQIDGTGFNFDTLTETMNAVREYAKEKGK